MKITSKANKVLGDLFTPVHTIPKGVVFQKIGE